LKPEFKNAVAINNPSISGPAYPFLYGMIQEKGMQGGKKFFLDLKNNGVQVFPKNGPTLKALLTGTVMNISSFVFNR
jgi:iron(III) transport system substrate-binding protein